MKGSSLSQLSLQCSCIYHNSGGTIFTKPPTQCPDSSPRLKTSAESTLKAEREEWMANGFLFVTLLQHLYSSFSPEAQPYGLTSAKCVLKRSEGPFHRPRSSSSPTPPAPPPFPPPLPSFSLTLSLSLTRWQGGTVIITQAGFMESGPMAKTKRHLSIPVGNTLSSLPSSSFHWCSQPH